MTGNSVASGPAVAVEEQVVVDAAVEAMVTVMVALAAVFWTKESFL